MSDKHRTTNGFNRFNKLTWARSYGAFSVSKSAKDKVIESIKNQEEHQREKTFGEEFEIMVRKYGLDQKNPG